MNKTSVILSVAALTLLSSTAALAIGTNTYVGAQLGMTSVQSENNTDANNLNLYGAMIGTTVDGGIGPNTLRALKIYCQTEGIEAAISDYTKMRQEFYEGLSTFDTFGRGWTRRNEETELEAYKMAGIYLPS